MNKRAFNCTDQGTWAWFQRTECCIELLKEFFASSTPISIADVGCGDGKLKRALENSGLSCRYQGYDLRPQSDQTALFDVRTDLFPLGFDVAVLLGVIEYIEHPLDVLRGVSMRCPYLLMSHVIKQNDEYTPQRCLELGWINHLSREELIMTLHGSGYEVMRQRMDKENKNLLVLCRSMSILE